MGDLLVSEHAASTIPEAPSAANPVTRRTRGSNVRRASGVMVPIKSIVVADSPRLAGISVEHARALAEVETALPPIIVQRATMQVLDGMHRLHAATLRGQEAIEVVFFEGKSADAFVVAVQANVEHGLPLSRADRNTAAARIVRSHPQWSDRMIASIAGLSPKTVGSIRLRSSDELPQSSVRLGRDGRLRPISRDERLRQLDQPVATRESERGKPRDREAALRQQESPDHQGGNPPKRQGVTNKLAQMLLGLRRDPSLRFTETGRYLLRFLEVHSISDDEWERLVERVPEHCRDITVQLARGCASKWQEFADSLAQRGKTE